MVMTRDNMITNRLVRQGRLPKSQLEVYPQRRKPATGMSLLGRAVKPMTYFSNALRDRRAINTQKLNSNIKTLATGMGALSNKEFKILKRKAKSM